MAVDDGERHVRVELSSRTQAGWERVEKYWNATHAEIIVREKQHWANAWADVKVTLIKGPGDADAVFQSRVEDVVRLCRASYRAGQRARSSEISKLLMDGHD
jgi:hypothetical protein